MHSKWLLVGFVSSALAACGGRSAPEPRSPESTPPENAAPGPTAAEPAPSSGPLVAEPAPQPLSDEQIAAVADAANTSEIDQARLAQQKAVHARVKDFAAMMIAHHSQAKEQQAELLKRLNVAEVETQKSAAVRDEGRRTLESLEQLNGTEFDRAYIDAQVSEHQRVLDTIDDELIPNAKNPELKAALEEFRPKVEAHLSEALDIQRMLGTSPVSFGREG